MLGQYSLSTDASELCHSLNLEICFVLSHLCSSSSFTVVQIGFESNLYTVNEGAGEVVVSVIVVSGILSGEVVVRLDTLDNTAIGRSSALPVI